MRGSVSASPNLVNMKEKKGDSINVHEGPKAKNGIKTDDYKTNLECI